MIKLGYCRTSKYRTKFFFQQNGEELEFYIDRDPETSMAELWINPGVDQVPEFIKEMFGESLRAKAENSKPQETSSLQTETNES